MKLKKNKNLWLKRVVVLLIPVLVILLYFFVPDWFIFPPVNRERISPKAYVEQKNILQGLSISLHVREHGSRNTNKIAITFDADMTPGMKFLLDRGLVKSWYNKEIKKILDREGTPATIFLGGLWTKAYPKEAKALAADPLIEIGNHSYNHYGFTRGCFGLPDLTGNKRDDVAEAQTIITEATGKIPKYFRFPGGCFARIDLQTIATLGLEVVHWDVVAGDGFNKNTASIIRNVESGVQNGSIIVFHIHDGNLAPKTADALRVIIPDLKKRGFQFVKISDLPQE